MATLKDYQEIVFKNPALSVCKFEIIKGATQQDDRIEFLDRPKNFRLYADPIIPDNVAILENLDYVAIP